MSAGPSDWESGVLAAARWLRSGAALELAGAEPARTLGKELADAMLRELTPDAEGTEARVVRQIATYVRERAAVETNTPESSAMLRCCVSWPTQLRPAIGGDRDHNAARRDGAGVRNGSARLQGSLMLAIGERKTTTRDISPGSDYWPQLLLDVQVSIYLEAGKLVGIDADAVLYDVLRVPSLRPLQATPPELRKYTKETAKEPSRLYSNQRDTDETPEEYGARCMEAIAADPDKHYQRQIVVRLEKEMLEARYDTWQTACGIRDARRLKVWPRNPDSCKQYGRPCTFFQVCTGTADINDPMLFQIRKKLHEELDNPSDDVMTQSALRCYRACPRRYFYRYEQRISPIGFKPEAMRRGTSLHRGLEAWSKTANVDLALDALDKMNAYSFEMEKAMMVGYIARWGWDKGVQYVEKEFEAPLISPESGAPMRSMKLAGKLDFVVSI